MQDLLVSLLAVLTLTALVQLGLLFTLSLAAHRLIVRFARLQSLLQSHVGSLVEPAGSGEPVAPRSQAAGQSVVPIGAWRRKSGSKPPLPAR